MSSERATGRNFATSFAPAIRTVVDNGDAALRSELEQWEPETRNAVARVVAELT